MDKQFFEQRNHFFWVTLLCVCAYFFLMFGNNIISLTHPDEVFYIQSAKEMLEHKSWLTPMIFDDIQFEKPFLAFAMFAAVIKWFGDTPFVARFWPAFFGILGVAATYWLGFLLFGRKRLAFFSGLVLSTAFIYIALSRAVLTDMIFTVMVLISLCFFCLAYYHRHLKTIGILCGYAIVGLAVLTKGLLGFLFPVFGFFLFLLYKRDLKFIKSWSVFWGLLLCAAIAVPWHVLMYKWYGTFFLEEYFGNVHVGRILRAEHPKLDNWYFYIGLMFIGVLPWSLFWIPGIKNMVQTFREKGHDRQGLAFLLAFIFSVYVFTQPAHSKLSSYIFPAFPAIAVLLGWSIDRALRRFEQENKGAAVFLPAIAMSIILLIVIIGGIIYSKINIAFVVSMVPVYVFAAILFLVGSLLVLFTIKKKATAVIFCFCGITVGLLTFLFLGKPYAEPWVSCRQICDVFKTIDNSDSTVLASKFYVRGVRYYTDRRMAVININGHGFFSPHPIPFLNTDDKVREFLSSQPITYAVVKEGDVDDLKRIVNNRFYTLEDLGGIGGKYILRIKKIQMEPLSFPRAEKTGVKLIDYEH